MKLIKQLNEIARTSMSKDVFERLVQAAMEHGADLDDVELMEVIHSLIENVAGYEDADDAVELANKVFVAVKQR